MIDLYFFPSPNTWKVAIMLEECGLPYQVRLVDITKDEMEVGPTCHYVMGGVEVEPDSAMSKVPG